MNLDLLLKGLSQVASSPLAFVAYVIVAVGWLSILWKESRIKNISKTLDSLPENQRLKALELEYKLIPKKGLSAQQYLKQEKRKFLFLAFSITAIIALIILSLTIYRYIQLDRSNVASETIKIAYESFIRGTTTADDNRFKTAVGKLEESLRISPTYSGYINLADIYDEIGDVEGALSASRKAAEIDASNPSPKVNIGMFLKDKGDLEGAEKNLLEAQKLFEEMGVSDDEFQVTILVNLGNVYYEKADAAAIEEEKIKWASNAIDECYSKALELRGEIKNKKFLANLLGNTANAYRILKKYDLAQSYMFESIALKERLAKQSPLWSSLGIGYFNLGDIYLKMERLTEAQVEYEKSEELFRGTDHAIGLGSVHLAYGEIAFMKNDFSEASKQWREAKKIFASHSLGLYVKKAEEKLGSLNKKSTKSQ